MSKIIVQHDWDGIKGLAVVVPKIFCDNRGYLFESYNNQDFLDAGLNGQFVQDNEVHNEKGVLRGIHVNRSPQKKLIRVLNGSIYDVVVDLRKESATYKKWCGIILSRENRRQLYIPEGVAHGYLSLTESDILFKVTRHFAPEDEIGFSWDSKELNIQWSVIEREKYIMNERDKSNPDFSMLDW